MNGKVVEEGGNALYVRKVMENKNKKNMMQFGWPGILGSPAIAKVSFMIRYIDGLIFNG
jgi:hypothetical protein